LDNKLILLQRFFDNHTVIILLSLDLESALELIFLYVERTRVCQCSMLRVQSQIMLSSILTISRMGSCILILSKMQCNMIQIIGIIDQNFHFLFWSWEVCAKLPTYEKILTITKFDHQILFFII
jgi:hypothetical protein